MIRLLAASALAAAIAFTLVPGVPPATATAQPPGKPLSAELSYVPSDAAIFIHLDAAKLWNCPIVKAVRQADAKTLDEFTNLVKGMFGSTPDSLQSLTLFWPKLKGPQDMTAFGIVGVFKTPYDKAKLAAGVEKVTENRPKVNVLTPSAQVAVVLVGLDEATYGKPQAAKTGPLTETIREAGSNRHLLSFGFTPAQMPDEIRGENIPEEVRPFTPLFSAESVSGFLAMDKELTVDIRVKASTPPRAKEAEKSLGFLTTMAADVLEKGMKELRKDAVTDPEARSLIAMLAALQTGAKQAKFTTAGESTRVVATAPAELQFVEAFLAAKKKVQQAAAQATSSNNLKQIALAMHNYHDANNAMPPAAVCDKKGKPMLSWRVLILPYIEEDALYKQFKLDEPWDSENNKKLIAKMPKVYAMPGIKDAKPDQTFYRAFVGNGAAHEYLKGAKLTEYADGTSNTLLVVTAKDSVIWTKPDELDFDPNKDMTKLIGFMPGNGCQVAFADGSVRSFSAKITKKTLHAYITRDGAEVVTDDE
jgi:prepilin-type processing-associated H-X9-DG protein